MTAVFAVSRKGLDAPRAGARDRAPIIHSSAVIAWGTYYAGLVLALVIRPGMAEDVMSGSIGTAALVMSLAAFMLSISLIQRHMGTALSASQTFTPPKLSTTGIFRYSRNPIYLAFLLPLAALAAYSAVAAMIAIAGYITLMNVFVIAQEEAGLRMKFGQNYEAYLTAAPRWLLV